MNTILCYGDSNTWGYIPATGERYPSDVRWCGVLRSQLGEGWEILEEGLNGRTTVFENPGRPGLNGLPYLQPCLLSHYPIDMLIIMLGTNDLVTRDAYQASLGIRRLIREFRSTCVIETHHTIMRGKEKILIIAPPVIHENMKNTCFEDRYRHYHEASLEFAPCYRFVAEDMGVDFLDAGAIAPSAPEDGFHLPPESHHKLGLAVAEKVREMFAEKA